MLVMGTNTWERDMPKKALIFQALKWSEGVKAKGIAELRGAYIANDQKLMWCWWETENIEALQAAFDEMNKTTGLKSKLTPIEKMYPK